MPRDPKGDAGFVQVSLGDIARVTGGHILSGDESTVFTSFHHHSNDASPGSLYIALKGERVDGHDFVKACYDKGCRGVLITDASAFERIKDEVPGMAAVVVSDPVDALSKLGREVIRRIGPKIVGITGSVGKTSTKEMTAAILSKQYRTGFSPGNLNTEIGMPVALLNMRGGEEIIVLEMATRGIGQITHLCSIAHPDVAIITGIGHSHIECFGSLDGIRKAKLEIVEGMSGEGAAVIFGDDKSLVEMASHTGREMVLFGESEDCEYRLANIAITPEGVNFRLIIGEDGYPVSIKHGSRGDAFNFIAATAAADALGVPVTNAVASANAVRTTGMRLRRETGPRGSLMIVDCYNANPESMRNAIELALANHRPGGRVIAVLGDMLELGAMSGAEHRSLGEFIAGKIDVVLAFGEEMRGALEVYESKGGSGVHFQNHRDIAEWLMDNASAVDVILLKGSRGMALERIFEYLKNG